MDRCRRVESIGSKTDSAERPPGAKEKSHNDESFLDTVGGPPYDPRGAGGTRSPVG